MNSLETVLAVGGLLALGVYCRKFIVSLLLGKSIEKSDELKKEEADIQKRIDEGRAALDRIPDVVHSQSDQEAFDEIKKNVSGG